MFDNNGAKVVILMRMCGGGGVFSGRVVGRMECAAVCDVVCVRVKYLKRADRVGKSQKNIVFLQIVSRQCRWHVPG